MTLVVFDMDRTLLDSQSRISPYTSETLALLRRNNIDYTIATGRTLQAALSPLENDHFVQPMVLKNGAVVWQPGEKTYSHHHLLTPTEVNEVISVFTQSDLNPFVFSLEENQHHAVYHAPLREGFEIKLAHLFESERDLPLEALTQMPHSAHVINISAMGPMENIQKVIDYVEHQPHLVAYSGMGITAQNLAWLDVHHSMGSKGNGVQYVTQYAGYDEIIAFGDGDNDISLFEVATESYAVANADPELKEIASAVIGHHDEDGVAHCLRERFNL